MIDLSSSYLILLILILFLSAILFHRFLVYLYKSSNIAEEKADQNGSFGVAYDKENIP